MMSVVLLILVVYIFTKNNVDNFATPKIMVVTSPNGLMTITDHANNLITISDPVLKLSQVTDAKNDLETTFDQRTGRARVKKISTGQIIVDHLTQF